jgi:hypothetical protein
MKNLLNKPLIFFLLPVLFYSCINNDYDIDNIDDSGGFNPAFALPIGTLKTNITDFIKRAGIEDPLQTGTDTIYVAYNGSMSLEPMHQIPGMSENNIFYIPQGLPIEFGFLGGEASVDIDVFKNLESSGSVLRPSNPKVYLTISNYIGANIDININSIKSYGPNQQTASAIFKNNGTSYVINVESAPKPHQSTLTKVTFDKTNGKIHELFAISPERISYDFSVNLNVSNDGNSHFLVPNKFVDIDYEIKIPFTFSAETRLASADTLDLDLSGEDFINSLDELKLWINYANRLRTTVDLEILFLDEHKELIPTIKKEFHMDAAPVSGGTNQKDALPAEGSFEISFDKNEIDDAKKTRYVILKSIFRTGASESEINIHPSDYVNLKLSAYLKVNI